MGLGARARRRVREICAHRLVVDAGDCGACLSEVEQLNDHLYDMHRLGFFITPTPRNADVLGVVVNQTRRALQALRKAYDDADP